MLTTVTLAAQPIVWGGAIASVVLLFVFTTAFIATRYESRQRFISDLSLDPPSSTSDS